MFPMKMMRGVQALRFLWIMKMRSALNIVLNVTMSERKTELMTAKKVAHELLRFPREHTVSCCSGSIVRHKCLCLRGERLCGWRRQR